MHSLENLLPYFYGEKFWKIVLIDRQKRNINLIYCTVAQLFTIKCLAFCDVLNW